MHNNRFLTFNLDKQKLKEHTSFTSMKGPIPLHNIVTCTFGESSNHFYALTSEGTLVSLTHCYTTTLDEPMVDAFCRALHFCVLSKSGRVWSGGDNTWSQIGHKNGFGEISFFQEHGISVRSVHPGYGHSIFVTTEGDVYALGSNDFGQCAQNSSSVNQYHLPTKCKLNGARVKMVATGYAQIICLSEDDELIVFGSNTNGQLGGNTDKIYSAEKRSLPVDAGRVVKMDCGQFHTVILTSDRNLYYMGRNHFASMTESSYAQLTEVILPEHLQSRVIDIFCTQSNVVLVTDTGDIFLASQLDKRQCNIQYQPTLHDLRIQGNASYLMFFIKDKIGVVSRSFPKLWPVTKSDVEIVTSS